MIDIDRKVTTIFDALAGRLSTSPVTWFHLFPSNTEEPGTDLFAWVLSCSALHVLAGLGQVDRRGLGRAAGHLCGGRHVARWLPRPRRQWLQLLPSQNFSDFRGLRVNKIYKAFYLFCITVRGTIIALYLSEPQILRTFVTFPFWFL